MARKDSKRNWKEIFLRIGPREIAMETERSDSRGFKNMLHSMAWEQENRPKSNEELRVYYKNVRAKPRGKRVSRDPVSKTDWFIIHDG